MTAKKSPISSTVGIAIVISLIIFFGLFVFSPSLVDTFEKAQIGVENSAVEIMFIVFQIIVVCYFLSSWLNYFKNKSDKDS